MLMSNSNGELNESSDRVIDTVRHHYTGRQILAALLRMWEESKTEPVILLTRKGEGESAINALRVALAKERNRQGTTTYYGLTTSEPFRWTIGWQADGGFRAEAVIVYWRQSEQQKSMYAIDTALGLVKESRKEGN